MKKLSETSPSEAFEHWRPGMTDAEQEARIRRSGLAENCYIDIDEDAMAAVDARQGPGYVQGWEARLADKPVDRFDPSTLCEKEFWLKGWNDADAQIKADLRVRTIDVDGDGSLVVVVKDGAWTGSDPDLVKLLNQRAAAIGTATDEQLAYDARVYLGCDN